jgi:hypothetical protein
MIHTHMIHTADREAVWLLSKERRHELFRDINDAILRELDFDCTDMIQECQWLHAYAEESIRRLEFAAEVCVCMCVCVLM